MIDRDERNGQRERAKVGCVLLASGFSTRFNSNKLLADFRGKPLISHTMTALGSAGFADICVVTRYPEVQHLAEEFSFRSILHDEPALSDTIRLGIGSFDEKLSGYMLCVADQPLLTTKTLRSLLERFSQDPSRIIRPKNGETPGNPVIFPAALRCDLLSLEGEQGGRAVIKKHPELLQFLEIENPAEFMDVDTAEALLQLR